jgi:hypothetical protein
MARCFIVLAILLISAHCAWAQGYVREPDAEYRSIPQEPTYRAFLPPAADLSAHFPEPGDQGQQSSCTAWAVGYGLRSYYEGLRQGWDLHDKAHQVSPAYIYDRLTEDHNRCSAGTSVVDALKLLKSSGALDLASLPYSAASCTLPASGSTSPTAQLWRIADWHTVNMARPDNIKGEIARGNPVVFGMDYSQSFENLKADAIYDDVDSPRKGGHAMVIVGYDDARQAFKVLNSWSTRWADKGFGWLSYRALTTLSDRGYVMSVPGAAAPALKPAETPVAQTMKPPPETQVAVAPMPPPPMTTPTLPPQPVKPPATVAVTPSPSTVAVVPPLPPAPRPPAPAPVTTESQRGRVLRTASELTCANVSTAPATGPVTSLSGFVASAEDRDKLARALGVDGTRIAAALSIHPWPQCEALLTFAGALAKPRGLSVQVAGAQPATLNGGSKLVVDVTTPDYPTYLYVTYLQASGDAVHLVQPAGLVPKTLPPHTKVTLGGADGGPTYRIGPPFGSEMIVAIATASPLFPSPRPNAEIERDYLTAFRLAFLEKPKPGVAPRIVAAAITTLTTRAR